MAIRLPMRRGFALAISMALTVSNCVPNADARQAYSSIQANIREEAEIEPFEGGRKAGLVQNWELLCKIEKDEAARQEVLDGAGAGKLDQIFILACMTMQGKGIEKNQIAAFELFKTAAMKGHSNSQNNLGFMFEEGIGTKKDLKQAFNWYKTAADYKNPYALCNLAHMYEHAIGIPANMEEAIKLYEAAAAGGNQTARLNLNAFEFEARRNLKFKGIQAAEQQAPAPPVGGKKAAWKPAAPVKPTFIYNPDALSNPYAKAEAAQAADAKPAAVKPAATPAPAVVAKPAAPAAPASAAKPGTATATANPANAVVNAIIAAAKKTPPAAAKNAPAVKDESKTASKKDAVSAKADKTAQAKPAPVKEEPVAEKPAESVQPSGLQAGSPTLTAILNRLSQGTSLQQPEEAKPEPAKVETPKTDAPLLLTSVAAEEKKPAAVEAKKEDKKVTAADTKKADKPTVAAKPKEEKPAAPKLAEKAKPAVAEKPAAEKSFLGNYFPAAEKVAEKPAAEKVAEKPAAEKAAEKPAAEKVAEKPAAEKPAVKPAVVAETKPTPKAEVKVVADKKAPAVVADAKKAETKPAPAKVADAKLAVTTGGADMQKAMADMAKTSGRPIRDKWALVVGITDFQDPEIPDLKYSAKDATDFYNYLVKEANFQPDHVRLLINEQATQRRVLSELGSKYLARVVKPDDLVVLYFSTHGSPSQMDARGKNYLVAQDSDPNDLFATGIEMQKLLDSIQGRVLTDRVLLVLDACHSGFAGDDSKGVKRSANFDVADLVQGSGQLVICSSLPDERAWESTRYQNGVFTHKLLEGLRSKGPKTSLVEAFGFARTAVNDEVREDRPGARQTPVLKGKWEGNDLILASAAHAPQVVPTSVTSNLETDSRSDMVARPKKKEDSDDDLLKATKPANDAPKRGVLYLDSQFFMVNGNPKEIAKEYGDAIRSSPNDPELYYTRAKALIQLNDWHNAMTCLNDALQISPNKAPYYLGRAYVYFRLGKKVQAQQDLDQAKFHDRRLANNIFFHM